MAIEGICKMMFSTKLCDDASGGQVEAILAQLLIQLFDRTHQRHNSLVRSILTVFFQNFAPFSRQRCSMLMGALERVMYGAIRAKYAKPAKKGRAKPAKDSDSEVDSDCLSDDSEGSQKKVPMA